MASNEIEFRLKALTGDTQKIKKDLGEVKKSTDSLSESQKKLEKSSQSATAGLLALEKGEQAAEALRKLDMTTQQLAKSLGFTLPKNLAMANTAISETVGGLGKLQAEGIGLKSSAKDSFGSFNKAANTANLAVQVFTASYNVTRQVMEAFNLDKKISPQFDRLADKIVGVRKELDLLNDYFPDETKTKNIERAQKALREMGRDSEADNLKTMKEAAKVLQEYSQWRAKNRKEEAEKGEEIVETAETETEEYKEQNKELEKKLELTQQIADTAGEARSDAEKSVEKMESKSSERGEGEFFNEEERAANRARDSLTASLGGGSEAYQAAGQLLGIPNFSESGGGGGGGGGSTVKKRGGGRGATRWVGGKRGGGPSQAEGKLMGPNGEVQMNRASFGKLKVFAAQANSGPDMSGLDTSFAGGAADSAQHGVSFGGALAGDGKSNTGGGGGGGGGGGIQAGGQLSAGAVARAEALAASGPSGPVHTDPNVRRATNTNRESITNEKLAAILATMQQGMSPP